MASMMQRRHAHRRVSMMQIKRARLVLSSTMQRVALRSVDAQCSASGSGLVHDEAAAIGSGFVRDEAMA